ncbi:MAG: 30S ribosomal protein S11 [Candidatus Liptonbacteria bacterium]|nr:30S ribosomal protein S11 [Candidatus Liptonbacteria bacterium]
MGKKKVTQPAGEAGAKGTGAAPSKKLKKFLHGRVYINASYNNTIVSVTDDKGGIVAWATAGSLGFSGPKKATPFAASKIMAVISEKLKASGAIDLDIIVKGIGSGRDSAVRSLVGQGFNIKSIKDVTPVPHNGPRPKKLRRV